jgi:pyruvate dehydrogenase E2 component (dihydrolipoamide acetyltransferase)
VSELLAKEGETVEVGTAIITISTQGHSMLTAPTPTLAQAAMANEVFVTDDS